MSNSIYGDTRNLKSSQIHALNRMAQRRVPPDRIVSQAIARDLLEIAGELNRQLGLFIDRRGRIERIIVGNAHSMELPEFQRVRGASGRLRGIRLLLTHAVPEAHNREELADLAKLRLDASAVIHQGPGGIQIDIACLRPTKKAQQSYEIGCLERLPLRFVAPSDDPGRQPQSSGQEIPFPFNEWVQELESTLASSAARSQEERTGTRAMVLQIDRGLSAASKKQQQDGSQSEIDARRAELRELCTTAGVQLLDIITQRRPSPDPKTFLGSGKLREVLIQALEQDVELLICDPELSASQARIISELTDLKVIDRSMLILDIFAQHAKSSDGKLQVEAAQLRYRLPRMIGKGSMMSRLAGGIGGRGPGESKLEIDRRRAKERLTDLERRLKR